MHFIHGLIKTLLVWPSIGAGITHIYPDKNSKKLKRRPGGVGGGLRPPPTHDG
jgi:hypothetical protein